MKATLTPVTLLWVVHFHQPLGTFPDAFERYIDRVLRPFLSFLERHPFLRITVHLSGIVLTRLKEKHEEVLTRWGVLVQRGQVELLGGGFYEPIFSLIPPDDAAAQLQLMADWLEREFGTTPRGAWLPESVWEPHFASILHQAGVDYTVLDESLFTAAGWKRAQLFHPFQTQYLNHPLTVFPAHRAWSKQIPLQNMRDIKAAFTQLAHRSDRQMIVLAQGGDQYGLWPNTYEALYNQGLLADWGQYLQAEQRWIETQRLGDALAGRWPLTYLPAGAMIELEPCALPPAPQRAYEEARTELQRRFDADRFIGFFRAGTWLNFLAKYAEAHLMQDKLLWLQRELQKLPRSRARESAEEKIWAAEEHTAYWHIESGGVYANYLRDAVYQKLIAAEKILVEEQDNSEPRLVQTDYNGDGSDEIILRTDLCGLVVVPSYGGSICEFNFWPSVFNLANTLRRRLEAYHPVNAPAGTIIEDWYERRMFQDHFVPPQTTRAQFENGSFVELGDFINQPYEITRAEYSTDTCSVTLERQGGLYLSGERRPLTCHKVYELTSPGRLDVNYTIFNSSPLPTDCLFVTEINYTLLDGGSTDRLFRWDNRAVSCGETVELLHQTEWSIEDKTRGLRWNWATHFPATLWHHAIKTVARPGNTPAENYQGSALLLAWPIKIEPGCSIEFKVNCSVSEISD